MMRDRRGSMAYWDKWVAFCDSSIKQSWQRIESPSSNPGYRPQYVYEMSQRYLRSILERYSRGDSTNTLGGCFDGLLSAWEMAEELGRGVWSEDLQYTRHAWVVNIDHYINCFWLVGLALTLNIADEQWGRLLALIGNEGEDALLDRVIASRQPGRRIGTKLCFPKAYQRLLEVLNVPEGQRPQCLRLFLGHWYADLKGAGSLSFPPMYRTPHWYTYGDRNFEGGAYFGRWCIEAVAVAKVFDIDDSLCLDHPNYPGDLLKDGRCPRYPDPIASPVAESAVPAVTSSRPKSWLLRFLGKD